VTRLSRGVCAVSGLVLLAVLLLISSPTRPQTPDSSFDAPSPGGQIPDSLFRDSLAAPVTLEDALVDSTVLPAEGDTVVPALDFPALRPGGPSDSMLAPTGGTILSSPPTAAGPIAPTTEEMGLFPGAAVGPWRFRKGFWPGDEGVLTRLVTRWRSRDVLRGGNLMSPLLQARADSFGLRLFPPDTPSLDPPERMSLQVTPLLEDGVVEVARLRRDDIVGPRVRFTLPQYLTALSRQTLQAEWEKQRVTGVRTRATQGQGDGLIDFNIPIPMPSQLQGIFGKGEPKLSVRGSERITFSGTSRWRPEEKKTELGKTQSKFPQLDMVQELNLQLTGTIGDKVSVDVDQSSQTTTPLANRIKIRYKGYEDEILQSVDLGNTNLVLPGTQYVTFNSRVEGLFGVSALARLADVDVNMILSKQEGRSDSKAVTRSAETRTEEIQDLEYVSGRYFFLRDPDLPPWDVIDDSLHVFVDDQLESNNTQDLAVPGVATLDGLPPVPGDPAQYSGQKYFRELRPGADGDYQIRRSFYAGQPVLELTRALGEIDVLAVVYRGRQINTRGELAGSFQVGQLVQNPSQENPLQLKMIRHGATFLDTDLTKGPFAPIRNLELKNIYDLGGRDILEEGFSLRIRLKRTEGASDQPDGIDDVTFLEMTGLDLQQKTGSDPVPGTDRLVDPEFISYPDGILFFPDLRPFDPDSSDLCLDPEPWEPGFGYCRFNPGGPDDPRKERVNTLPGPQGTGAYRAPRVYDRLTHPSPQDDSRYYLEVTYRSAVSNIQLNAFNILPGSEVVTAAGRTLRRDIDYQIDYDLGEVELLDAAQVSFTDDVRVTYSYLPFGGGSQKTLAGAAASYKPTDSKLKFSTAWLFEGKSGVPGLQGRRPRLGEEPSRTLVGEFATTYRTESWLMTQFADALPGVDARQPSRLDIDAGLGISLPNPNTENKLYIDDFDGAKDVYSLSMNRRTWRPAGPPVGAVSGLAAAEIPFARGEAWWYTPRSVVQEGDLQPTLDPREGDDNRTVLELRLFPAGESVQERERSWVGLVQPLSKSGIDFSRAQFLDVWVNDFVRYDANSNEGRRRGKLTIDLGRVSEDAQWKRQDPKTLRLPRDQRQVEGPNNRLDTEDTQGDGRLDESNELEEDTGLDGILSGRAGDDPLDDYDFDDEVNENNPRKYAFVNGLEGNQDLDTEDMNGNGSLDSLNSYFQLEIDLADSTLWETDVYRDYVVRSPGQSLEFPIDLDNGWRRIRIPLQSDSLVTAIAGGGIQPTWDRIFHARISLSGFEDSTRFQIGGIEITGNRWYEGPLADERDRPLPDSLLVDGENFFVSVLNNKDDAAVYQPPFTPGEQNNLTEREQSITLELRRLQPGHRASIYRPYPTKQDYTLYENLELYLNSRLDQGDADLTFALRLCRDANSDTTNYYEFRRPVPRDWDLVRLDFAVLAQLQLDAPDSTTGFVEHDLGGGVILRRKGSPSLTSIQRIALYVENSGPTELVSGNVWIDELRLTEVKRDTGIASRFGISGNFSDLLSFNTNFVRTNADFLKIGSDRGSGTTNTTIGASSTISLDRFVPRARVSAPLRVSLSRSRSVPKFQTSSDLVVVKPTDRDISERDERELSLSLRKETSENPWIRYLVAPFGVNGSVRRSTSLVPTQRDTTTTRNGSVAWSSPRDDLGKFRLGAREGRGFDLQFLPNSLSATLTGATTTRRYYTRTDLSQPFKRSAIPSGNNAGLSLGAGFRPISLLTWRVDSSRDLLLRRNQMTLLGANLGRETQRRHTLSSSYDIPVLRAALGPRLSLSSGSSLSFLRTGGTAPGEPDRYNDYQNNRSITASSRLAFSELVRALRGRRTASPQTSDPDEVLDPPRGTPDDPPETEPIPPPETKEPPAAARSRRSLPFTVGVINANYTLARTHGVTRTRGEPTMLYQLGLSDQVGDGVEALSRSTVANGEQKTLALDTVLQWQKRITVNVRYNRTASESATNTGRLDDRRTRWPELDLNWGEGARVVVDKIGLQKRIRSIQATTRYSRELGERGRGGDGGTPRNLESRSETNRFAPLMNLTLSFNNGLSASLTSATSTSRNTSFTAGSQKDDLLEDKQLGLSCKKTLNLVRRINVPLSNTEKTITSRVDLNGAIEWRTNRSESRIGGQTPTIGRDSVNLKFIAGAGYQFTSNINGSASINFGQDTDRKTRSLTQRFVGLSVSASFTF